MPNFQVINTAAKQPSFGQQFLESLLQTLPQSIGKSQRQNYEAQLIQALLQGGDINTALNPKRPSGILENLFDVINPRGTYRGGIEGSPIASNILSAKLGQLMRDPLEIETAKRKSDLLEAQIETEKVMPEYYREGGRRSRTTIKPMSFLDLERAGAAMDSRIKAASKWKIGGPNYKRDKLLNAWEEFKESSDYDNLPDNQQQQLWAVWNRRIKALGNEAEWDINSPEVKSIAPQKQTMEEIQGGTTKTQGRSPYPEYPDAFFENGMWKIIRNGQKFRIED